MQSLHDLFYKYKTDKAHDFHNYSRQYESILAPYRSLNGNVLEIGVFDGASIKAWREAFLSATNIIGVDIRESCLQYRDESAKIQIEIGDISDPKTVPRLREKYGTFDFIIDDGSHKNKDVIYAFENLFPLLNDGGLYIVEDTICYKAKGYIDTKYPNHLDYFTALVPFLNQWRYDSLGELKDNCVDPFKIEKKTSNVLEQGIDKIEFACSFIAISKKLRKHWIPTNS